MNYEQFWSPDKKMKQEPHSEQCTDKEMKQETYSEQCPDKEMKQEPYSEQSPDKEIKEEPDVETSEEGTSHPPCMKSKLLGVKKLTTKELRRRQNEQLRRILTPKNALMTLNEIIAYEQLTNHCHVEPVQTPRQLRQNNFRAYLTVDGVTYKAYGENKVMARNAAAEDAIRDIIMKRMIRAASVDPTTEQGQSAPDQLADDDVPMIQLASYALHKLFAEWKAEGHRVPQLPAASTSELDDDAATVNADIQSNRPDKKPPTLPSNATTMHPCGLLTHMRPITTYRLLAAEGDRPQNTLYTVAVVVDGTTYVGKASNKKGARKAAAISACEALFNIKFDQY